jgi:hypothetical protein
MPSSGSPIWTCWDGAQCRKKQRRMGAVYCDRRRNGVKSDSLMMAFWNAETFRSILSTNTLNEWCICWSFTHHKIMHSPKCKGLKMYSIEVIKRGVQHLDKCQNWNLIWGKKRMAILWRMRKKAMGPNGGYNMKMEEWASKFTNWTIYQTLIGEFIKFGRATISFVFSVRPHVRTRLQLNGCSWNLTRATGTLREYQYTFLIISRPLLLGYYKMFQAKVVEKIRTHFMFNKFFWQSCRLWDVVKYCRSRQATDDNIAMRISCWPPKVTDTPRIYNTYRFPLQQCLHERTSILLYTYNTLLLIKLWAMKCAWHVMPMGDMIRIY